MINPTTKRGVLNDWDLSYYRPLSGCKGHVAAGERTGTLPFMPLDLLSDEAWKGNVQRLYRHDLEGFFPGSSSSLRVQSGPTISLQVGKPTTLKDAPWRSVACSPSFNSGRTSPQRSGQRSGDSQFHCFIGYKWRKGSGGKTRRHPPYHLKTSSIGSMMRCARLSDATNPWENSCRNSRWHRSSDACYLSTAKRFAAHTRGQLGAIPCLIIYCHC